MFFFEILIYAAFAFIMMNFAIKSNEEYENSSKIDLYLWYYIMFFTIISAIRWRVGVDSESYIKIFKEGNIHVSNEHLWDALVLLVHDSGFHFVVGTAITAFIQIYFLVKGVKEFKYILIWLPVVIFGGRYFFDISNAVRQMLVACGYVYLSQFIVDKKLIRFFIGIIILSGIHQSALILLPTYLLGYIPYEKLRIADKRIICLILLFVCFILGQTPSFQNLMDYIEPALSLLNYERLSKYYANKLEGKLSEQLSMGPIMLSFLFSSAIVIWYAPKLKKEYESRIPYFNLWYFLSLVYSCGYFLVCNLGHMFIRPFQYFELFLAINCALLLHFFYTHKEKYQIQLYGFILLIWLCNIVSMYKDTGRPYEVTTYKVFFNRI